MTLILIAYAVVALLTFRRSFRLSYARETEVGTQYCFRNQRERFWAALLVYGPLKAAVWPLFWPTTLLNGTDLDSTAKRIGGEDRDEKRARKDRERDRKLREAEANAAERERYIATMERELKIGPYA